MAILVDLFKEYEDERIVKYRFADVDKPPRTLVFDKQSETIQPEDGVRDVLFRAAAGKLAGAWSETGEFPDHLRKTS